MLAPDAATAHLPSITLFPPDHPAGGLASDWLRDIGSLLKPPDPAALQAQWQAQVTLGGEFGGRLLDAWRQVVHANLRLARGDSDALLALSHQLLDCREPGHLGSLLAGQIQPAAERWRTWQEQLLDACAGVQSNAALLAERYVPPAGSGAAAITRAAAP